jgi:HAD superfamily hydrolase (TIGR01509 family)
MVDVVNGGLAAVLFDMDGTLIDTEKVWEVAIRELARSYGATLSAEARRAMLGTSSEQTMQLLLADLDQPWRDPVEGAEWIGRRVMELFEEGVEWRPGARELLEAVRAAGLPTALVTNTDRTLVNIALRTLGPENFDVVVCGDEVDHAKPHPGHYLAAARALGVDPTRCVAIEDSPAGVASATAAGCKVLAIPHETPLGDVSGLVLASLREADVATLRGLVGAAA